MSKLVKKFDYNLNKNFYDAPFKAEPSTNRYDASKDLLYWLRFVDGSRPQELSLAQNSASTTYVGSVYNSESLIGNRKYPSLVAKANNYTTFLDERINFYDFDTVDAFTASIWILPKQNPNAITKILDFKYENTASVFLSRVSLELLTNRNIQIKILNNVTNIKIPAHGFGIDINDNEWNNFVFVYEKGPGNLRKVKYYVNGNLTAPANQFLSANIGIGPGPLEIINFSILYKNYFIFI